MKKTSLFFLLALCVSYSPLRAQTIVVDAGNIRSAIQPTMWGIFFEDINLGADGGLYPELVKNRSFEFATPMMGWRTGGNQRQEGDFLALNTKTKQRTARFLRIRAKNATTDKDLTLVNEGFRGMGVKQAAVCRFSLSYRSPKGGIRIHARLVDTANRTLGETVIDTKPTGNTWRSAGATLVPAETNAKAKLLLWFEGSGLLDIDNLSLFPSDTWKNRPGGLRSDMVQMLADLKPGFIRFPGGCIVEGRDLATRYQWKKTIGAPEDRELIINRWNTEFANRSTPDYFQSFGLGFYEYFLLAEDIGASPLPILNCGMACQFNTAELVPLEELGPYVQDALDLVEFANGDTATHWGKIRAKLGHPAPFNLKMMGIGNENWGPQYLERLAVFTNAIKKKYPNIRIVNSSGTDPDGARFDLLNTALRKNKADIIDEHYYRNPEWFLQQAGRYDQYDRNSSKIFAGEYAAHPRVPNGPQKNNWQGALAEAAFMTGLERNADVVHMASYAPLFAHAEGWQWTPDLIWVDNLRAYGSPGYYVQQLFSANKGTHTVSILQNGQPVAGKDSVYASACIDKAKNELVIKMVNASGIPKNEQLQLKGFTVPPTAMATLLKSDELTAGNTFDNPKKIAPVTKTLALPNGDRMAVALEPYSVNMFTIKMK
ncbi:alpha-L-arabinofuranosidase C-terminal domain-containing protein [Sediminibacterium soli]|uniref:alpha-L-arabinofuranosidase C-terminal domain-containing protein n=1 Tax=Sediminibacterium soli TaxID=2698829 RepID=UPI00137A347C|nr:alpha-L-arabinofuranosidase C-terminal domain-containing protein [Sediminibacterium soli]NCI48156.1 alpha-L-arabinofuranosidase [Sediminibacterium soli]